MSILIFEISSQMEDLSVWGHSVSIKQNGISWIIGYDLNYDIPSNILAITGTYKGVNPIYMDSTTKPKPSFRMITAEVKNKWKNINGII